MAGRSAGLGGVISTAAYLMKVANFGFACVISAEIKDIKQSVFIHYVILDENWN